MTIEEQPKNRGHVLPDGSKMKVPEALYDINVRRASHAEEARTLAERHLTGTLCSVSKQHDGHPYGSFVTFAMHEGQPIFLISGLAEHTKNLMKNPKASLLISDNASVNPLASARATLIGQCKRLDEEHIEAARATYLHHHPEASAYVDFRDFNFFGLEVSSIRYIGGFGKMSWFEQEDWISAEPDPLNEHAHDIIQHMNEDHADAMVLYCQTMSRATDVESAIMTSIDRYGFEMDAVLPTGTHPIRLAFNNEVSTPDEARIELVRMVKEARKKATSSNA
ncbi:MAG TPA: DUF2470 domain-containing protein [Candidatus Poseidoniales archaeon]|nr:MAG TPA: DUF2470 domain-containing protein [Candidatus Poseidoniales archaeon]HII77865.1 DUF2470 domain-containing protein [Poseidonia sp.]|tara:strand:- start:215 stop:1054 length:840 start_codon:yes stop_codon:yes gene_type:complete